MTGIIISTPPAVELPPGSSGGGPNTLPPVTYQYAVTNAPNTWSGVQTYINGSMRFAGSTSGFTLLNATAIASGTLALPAETGTLATQAYVQGNAGPPSVFLEQFGGGTGVDNTLAFNLAVASVPGAVKINLGRGTYNFSTSPAVITKSQVIIEGSGTGVTVLAFTPTADATFLEVNSGFAEGVGFQIRNLTIYSQETTFNKTALKLVDQSSPAIENVTISGAGAGSLWTGGANGSIGIHSQGREFLRTKNVGAYADIQIRLGKNPNSYISTDFYDLSGLILIGGTTYPNILIDPGVVISSAKIDASLNLGTHGIYWNDTSAANHVSAVNNGGSGYVAGEVITLAGGTFSSAITIRVLTVSAGVITAAAVLNPGIYTVLPTYPASQGSTTGSGTGATFTCVNATSNNLRISGRSEQGTNVASTSIYLAPSSRIDNVTISDFCFDSNRKGLFIRNVKHTTVANTQYTPVGATLAVDADTSNECLLFENALWRTGSTSGIGLPFVYVSANPTGEAIAPFALYSNTFSGMSYAALAAASAILTGSSSGSTTLKAAATASGTLTLPAATDTLVGKATTDEFTNKTVTAAVAKGIWTASGTWTVPAHTLGGAVSGGGNQINNVVIGASTPLAGSFTTVVSSGGITPTVSPSTAWSVDASGMTQISIAASGSSPDFTSGSGLVVVSENTSYGHTAQFICGAGAAFLVAQAPTPGGVWSATTTPAGANVGFGFSGTGYRIYNGTGATRTFTVLGLKSRAAN